MQNTPQLGLCFLASLVVSWLIATLLLTTTSAMLTAVLLATVGYEMQSQRASTPQTDDHVQVVHGGLH